MARFTGDSILARALVAQGRADEAEPLLRAAVEGTRESQLVWERIGVTLNAAKADVELGREDDARRRLEALRDEAAGRGWTVTEMECRLLLARLALRSGDAASGLAALQAVEDDARSLGLTLFARLASEAAAASS